MVDAWNFRGGDLVSIFLVNVLVGQPLLHLLFELASLVPFLVSLILVSVSVASLMTRSQNLTARRCTGLIFLLTPTFALAWLAFWWTRVLSWNIPFNDTVSEESSIQELLSAVYLLTAESVTSWQTVNAQYVTATCLALLLFLALNNNRQQRIWFVLSGYFFIGFLIGFAGKVLATLSIVMLCLYTCFALIRGHRVPLEQVLGRAIGVIVCGTALVLTQFVAPGQQIRNQQVITIERIPFQINDFLTQPSEIVRWVFPRAILEWLVAFVSAGTLIVIISIAIISYLLARNGVTFDRQRLMSQIASLLAFSIILSLVNRLSEAFAYPGFWHQIPASTILFFSACLIGVYVSTWFQRSNGEISDNVVGMVATVMLFVLLLPVSYTVTRTQERLEVWNSGAAPIYNILDIEDWPGKCWNQLRSYRDLPRRDSRY